MAELVKATRPSARGHHQRRVHVRAVAPNVGRRGQAITSLQRNVGNQSMHRLLGSAVIQTKLTVGPADDEYEREADRVADEVMRMPTSPPEIHRNSHSVPRKCHECESADSDAAVSGHIRRKCAACAQEEEERSEDERRVQAKSADAATPEVASDVDAYLRSSGGRGRPLDPDTRSDFEARFGQDFEQVRVHDDGAAAASARTLNARAYTFGHNIVFGSGEFAPATSEGRRLLSHELTHVVQQGVAARDVPGNALAQSTIRRDDKPPQPSKAAQNQHYVIGDKNLDVGGGTFLAKMETLKTALMKTSPTGGAWTLSITMHGAEKFFALTGRDAMSPLAPSDKRVYGDTRVQQIFGDAKFQEWRKKHGPKTINLLSCQVGADLANKFLSLVLHPSSNQKAIGLGEGCLLLLTREYNIVRTRDQYGKLESSEKSRLDKWLTELNDKYGYAGEKIKSAELLDYYFDVPPGGSWLKLEIIITKKSNKRIPAMTRTTDSDFNVECAPGSLKQRTPSAPVVGDEQEE
jgi:Domain of unknown function (DUF4157)